METFYSLIALLSFGCFCPVVSQPSNSVQKRPIEKLYLHQDRTCYAAGETIWFKLYQILSASAGSASGVAYVDLIDRKGEAVAQAKYPLKAGQASGSFDIPAELPTGGYQIRAYTQWMLNEGTDGFFRRELRIKGFTDKEAVHITSDSMIYLRFFPEGGNLVEGVASKIAMEAVDGWGRGIAVEGTVFDANKEVVQRFQTNTKGLGSFFFQPQAGQRYFAQLEKNDTHFNFPKAMPTGFVVNVKRFKDVLRILLTQNAEAAKEPRSYSLVFHQGGHMLAQLPVASAETRSVIDIPLNKLPAGVFTVTLIDEDYKVYCERLVFARYPETLDINLTSKVTQKDGCSMMTIDIGTREGNGKPCPAHLSLAVVAGVLENPSARANFKTYLFLESELKGRMPERLYDYWKPGVPESLSDIELLLLTHGWCRYSLNDLHAESKQPVYPMEQSLSIGGKVQKGTRKNHDITVQAVLRQDSLQEFVTCPLDEEGRFALTNYSFEGTKEVIFSATDARKQTYPIELDTPRFPPLAAYMPSSYTFDSYQLLPIEKGMVKLDEVKVIARKQDKFAKRRSYSEGFVKTSFDVGKDSYGDMRRLLQKVPGLTLVPNRDKSKANLPLAHINGTPAGSVVTFVLNDFVVHDPEMVYSMDASRVERVEVLQQTATLFGGFRSGGGIVVIYTKENQDAVVSDNKQICQWIGFHQTKEFYVPVVSDAWFFRNEQPRNTLYWNPEVTTDAAGKAQVSFYLKNSEKKIAPLIHCEGYSEGGLIGSGALK